MAREGKVFFSEEKKQKTFIPGATPRAGHGLERGCGGEIKVFWFAQGGLRLSSEKNILSSFPEH
jgi:hypothetical protein